MRRRHHGAYPQSRYPSAHPPSRYHPGVYPPSRSKTEQRLHWAETVAAILTSITILVIVVLIATGKLRLDAITSGVTTAVNYVFSPTEAAVEDESASTNMKAGLLFLGMVIFLFGVVFLLWKEHRPFLRQQVPFLFVFCIFIVVAIVSFALGATEMGVAVFVFSGGLVLIYILAHLISHFTTSVDQSVNETRRGIIESIPWPIRWLLGVPEPEQPTQSNTEAQEETESAQSEDGDSDPGKGEDHPKENPGFLQTVSGFLGRVTQAATDTTNLLTGQGNDEEDPSEEVVTPDGGKRNEVDVENP